MSKIEFVRLFVSEAQGSKGAQVSVALDRLWDYLDKNNIPAEACSKSLDGLGEVDLPGAFAPVATACVTPEQKQAIARLGFITKVHVPTAL